MCDGAVVGTWRRGRWYVDIMIRMVYSVLVQLVSWLVSLQELYLEKNQSGYDGGG